MLKTPRGSNWSEDEIRALIDIWKEPEMKEKVNSNKRAKVETWAEIAARLDFLGFPPRTGPQVQNKIKDLRRSYQRAKDAGLSHGEYSSDHQFPFHHLLGDVIVNKESRPIKRSHDSQGAVSIIIDGDSSTEGFDDTNGSIVFTLSEDENQSGTSNQVDGPSPAVETLEFEDSSILRQRLEMVRTNDEECKTSTDTAHSSNPHYRISENMTYSQNQQHGFSTDVAHSRNQQQGDLAQISNGHFTVPPDITHASTSSTTIKLEDQEPYIKEEEIENMIEMEDDHPSCSNSPPPRLGKKRPRLNIRDKTIDTLTKKMKEITAASDRKFLMMEERRRRDELEQRKEDRKCMKEMIELIRQGMADQREAEERRSRDLHALLELLANRTKDESSEAS